MDLDPHAAEFQTVQMSAVSVTDADSSSEKAHQGGIVDASAPRASRTPVEFASASSSTRGRGSQTQDAYTGTVTRPLTSSALAAMPSGAENGDAATEGRFRHARIVSGSASSKEACAKCKEEAPAPRPVPMPRALHCTEVHCTVHSAQCTGHLAVFMRRVKCNCIENAYACCLLPLLSTPPSCPLCAPCAACMCVGVCVCVCVGVLLFLGGAFALACN